MRVPPDQSSTCAVQRASASSGSRRCSERVTLVSRVPNRKVETRRVCPSACRKCRNSRVYSAIEPEMSQSATTGGALSRGARNSRSMIPLQRAAEAAARIDAHAAPVGREAARRAAVVGHDEPVDERPGLRDLGRAHLREIALLQDFRRRHGEPRVEIERGLGLFLLARRVLEHGVGDAGRAGLRRVSACASGRACGDIIAISFSMKPLRFQ